MISNNENARPLGPGELISQNEPPENNNEI